MRNLAAGLLPVVVACSFIGLSAGCTTEETNAPLLTRVAPPPRRKAAAEPPPEALVPERLDVSGTVVTDVAGGASGREVIVVDARGERHDAVTDDRGAFAIKAVSAPYDLTVVPVSSGPAMVYLGVRRVDPYVEIFERDRPVPSVASQTVRIGVHLEDSACSTTSGWVTAVTTSPSGTGSAMMACRPGDDVVVVDVEHVWTGSSLPTGERIDVHALVEDIDESSFAYARRDGVTAVPGETTDAGDIGPVPIGVTNPVKIGARGGTSGLSEWQWSTSVSLDLSGDPRGLGEGILFAVEPAASARVVLPLIPGATMRANVFAQHPRANAQGPFFRSTEAWSEGRVLSTGAIEVDVAPGPEMVRPVEGGTLSRSGLGFEWGPASASLEATLGAPTLSTLSFADASTGAVGFRVFTIERAIPLERLGALGVAKLDLGNYWLDLVTSPGTGVDEATSPDTALRRRRFDRTRGGVATFLRVPFQVTE